MKFIVFFLFNILISDMLSDWLEVNSHIINSNSYRISFNQKDKSVIGGHVYSQIDTSTDIFIFNDQILYESKDKLIILSKDEFKFLNRITNQLFIEVADKNLTMFFDSNLIEILSNNIFIKGCYNVPLQNLLNLDLCFNNDGRPRLEILNQNMNIELYDIELYSMDSINIAEYFKIDEKSLSVFDLRKK